MYIQYNGFIKCLKKMDLYEPNENKSFFFVHRKLEQAIQNDQRHVRKDDLGDARLLGVW